MDDGNILRLRSSSKNWKVLNYDSKVLWFSMKSEKFKSKSNLSHRDALQRFHDFERHRWHANEMNFGRKLKCIWIAKVYFSIAFNIFWCNECQQKSRLSQFKLQHQLRSSNQPPHPHRWSYTRINISNNFFNNFFGSMSFSNCFVCSAIKKDWKIEREIKL